MSRCAPTTRPLFAMLAISLLALPAAAGEQPAMAAHSIADKFSSAMDKKGSDGATPAPDLAKSNAERIRLESQAAQLAEDRMKAETAELLERALLEATERQAEEARRKDGHAAATAEQATKRTAGMERTRQATKAAKASETALLKDETRRAMEAEREAEAEHLSEKLRKVREAREAAHMATGPVAPDPEARMSLRAAPAPLNQPPTFNDANGRRVTVLLVMEPGNRGIRRFEKTADPVLCLGETCFVGTGSDKPAKAMPRAKTLGAGNTLGKRAWSCRHSLNCIFREIELDAASTAIQPVDLRILRHDRRAISLVSADKTCSVFGGQLACGKTVRAAGYKAWIIPEVIAREAGPQRLEAALASDLNDARAAALDTSNLLMRSDAVDRSVEKLQILRP